jgi:hypothetical protein
MNVTGCLSEDIIVLGGPKSFDYRMGNYKQDK